MEIKDRIKAIREGKGWSLQFVAARMTAIEGRPTHKPVNWQSVQQWELGQGPTRKRLAALAAALETTEADLLGLAKPAAPPLDTNAWPFSRELLERARQGTDIERRRAENAARNVLDLDPLPRLENDTVEAA